MKQLLQSLKGPLTLATMVSTGVNMLMLVSPIFMMQVFDRVLMSGHLETLYGLTALAVFALLILGIFEALRQQILVRAGDWLERSAGDILIDASLARGIPAQQVFQQVTAVKSFFCAQGVFSLLDAPWLIVFAALLWWMHPWLGIVAVTGAILLAAIAVATELASRRPVAEATQHQQASQAILSSALRNADAVRAMGMTETIKELWQNASTTSLNNQSKAAERSAIFTGMAKAVRLIVQTAILAVGALLVLDGSLSSGGMIAASILLGRCLAPVEQAIGAWKSFVLARDAWRDLSALGGLEAVETPMDLPPPEGHVAIEGLTFHPNDARPPILADVSFNLSPGQVTILVGASGSGKSTLCRLAVGAFAPTSGAIRLDGRAVTGWNPAQLGHFVGYLPQGVELLPGTIRDNIQRFGQDDPEGVIEAAKLADVDQLIRSLADGYDSMIVPSTASGGDPLLSTGQLQRVALARALYGKPKLVVLDEPNANLDVEGERALRNAISAIAKAGATVMVVTHRPALLEAADRIAVLHGGRLISEGPRDTILRPQAVETPNTQADGLSAGSKVPVNESPRNESPQVKGKTTDKPTRSRLNLRPLPEKKKAS